MNRRLLHPAVFVAVAALCLGVVLGCGDDDDDKEITTPTQITLEDFAGSWTATMFRVTSHADPQMQFDFIALGGSVSMVAHTDGTFTGQAGVPDPESGELLTVPLEGRFALVDQETVEVIFTPEIPPLFTSFTAGFTLSQDTLEFADPNTTFDFDGDGQEEPATFDGSMVRS